MAHDFNNLLAVILNYASLMLSRPKKSKENRAELEEIEGAARRATELTRQLLAFTRQPTFQTSVVDINEVLSEFQPMLSRVLGEDVEFGCRSSHSSAACARIARASSKSC